MKTKLTIVFAIILFQLCNAQQLQTVLPKIENYTKGELEIKVAPFGLEHPISVGKITADGTIHFNWPALDLNKIEDSDLYKTPIKQFIGGSFCKDPNAVITNKNVKPVKVEYLYLHKYNQVVGYIVPSTQIALQGQGHNKEQLGSTLYWVYSENETSAKASCSKNKRWEGAYDFNETTVYDFQFKKGWNLVSYTLKEIEEWDNGKKKGSLPKTKMVQSVAKIPSNIHWNLNYTADDELLEIEHKLVTQTPITKEQYESWLPKKLGNLKRTTYEIGKTLERMPTLNNIEFIFEKGNKKTTVTLVDCAGNKDAASMYTLMKDMASRDWKDDQETGYRGASKMDDTRVMTVYNEKEAKTTLNYNANGRFLVKAEGTNIKPEELWEILKGLQIEKLLKN